jgi:hypothetical protein
MADDSMKPVPIVPVPEDAPACTWRHPEYGEPVAMWPYHNVDGQLLAYAARVEFVGKDGKREKAVLPITYCRICTDERRAWRAHGLPPPRPLYRLPELLADPTAPVIVCEGEKKADVVPALFPGYLGTTSMGGAGAAAQSDWSPLAGREVAAIWPDNDEPGHRYAEDVARLATAAGAASVVIVAVPRDWPEGWDLADPLPDGVPPETLARLLAGAAPWTPPAPSGGAVDDGDAVEIARLATLSPLAYARERKAAAERLVCPLSILDKAVSAERGNGATPGRGGIARRAADRPARPAARRIVVARLLPTARRSGRDHAARCALAPGAETARRVKCHRGVYIPHHRGGAADIAASRRRFAASVASWRSIWATACSSISRLAGGIQRIDRSAPATTWQSAAYLGYYVR